MGQSLDLEQLRTGKVADGRRSLTLPVVGSPPLLEDFYPGF